MSDVDTALNAGGGDDEAAAAAAAASATDADKSGDANKGAAGDADKDKGGDGGDDDKSYWPVDWQRRGDEKRQELVGRYGSPEAAFDALDAAQQRIRSGELLPALPDDPTEDELKEWRKSRDIPADAKGYDLKDIEIEAEDKDTIESLVAAAHASDQGQDQVVAGIKWYYETKATQAAARQELDATQRDETVGALNVEWGANYRRNQNLVKAFLSRVFPEEARVALEGGRFADGRGFFNNPDIMRSLLAVELEINPAGIVPPRGEGDIQQGLDDEIAEIKKWMRSPRDSEEGKKYWKDKKVQDHYVKLIEIRDKTSATP